MKGLLKSTDYLWYQGWPITLLHLCSQTITRTSPLSKQHWWHMVGLVGEQRGVVEPHPHDQVNLVMALVGGDIFDPLGNEYIPHVKSLKWSVLNFNTYNPKKNNYIIYRYSIRVCLVWLFDVALPLKSQKPNQRTQSS